MRRHGLDWPLGFAFFGTALHPRCVGIASCWHCATLLFGYADHRCACSAARAARVAPRRHPYFVADASPPRLLASLLETALGMAPDSHDDALHRFNCSFGADGRRGPLTALTQTPGLNFLGAVPVASAFSMANAAHFEMCCKSFILAGSVPLR